MAEVNWLALPTELSWPVVVGLLGVSFAGSFISAALGLGGGVLLLSVMASVLPPSVLIPIHGAVQLASNAGRASLLRSHVCWPLAGYFSAGAVFGAVIGGAVVFALPAFVLKLIMGLFILYAVWAPRFRVAPLNDRQFTPVGAVTTFATMFVGGSGPLVATFLAPLGLPRHALVGTHATCMSAQHSFKVVAFVWLGFDFLPWLPVLAAMIVTGGLGTWIGRRLLNKMPAKRFNQALKVVLTILALRLLWSAALAML